MTQEIIEWLQEQSRLEDERYEDGVWKKLKDDEYYDEEERGHETNNRSG